MAFFRIKKCRVSFETPSQSLEKMILVGDIMSGFFLNNLCVRISAHKSEAVEGEQNNNKSQINLMLLALLSFQEISSPLSLCMTIVHPELVNLADISSL